MSANHDHHDEPRLRKSVLAALADPPSDLNLLPHQLVPYWLKKLLQVATNSYDQSFVLIILMSIQRQWVDHDLLTGFTKWLVQDTERDFVQEVNRVQTDDPAVLQKYAVSFAVELLSCKLFPLTENEQIGCARFDSFANEELSHLLRATPE